MSSAEPESPVLGSRFQRAAADLRLPQGASWVQISDRPERWDEAIETGLPLLIGVPDLALGRLLVELQECGLPLETSVVVLVEPDGTVREATEGPLEEVLGDRVLAVGWSHPDQGWRARRPLSGRTYLVTRARPQGERLAQRLRGFGARALVVPTITFQEPDSEVHWRRAVAELESFDWTVFTSKNGVEFFLRKLWDSGKDARAFRGRIAAIGPATARALKRFGLTADLLPGEFVAESLLESLLQTEPRRVLIPRAQEAREVLPVSLRERGIEVLVAPVYRTVIPEATSLEALKVSGDARILFTASSTVKNWMAMTDRHLYPCHCIGPITAATAISVGLTVLSTAGEYTEDGLLDAILEHDRTH